MRLVKPKRDPIADPEGVVRHPDYLDEDASTVLLAKDCAAILERHYPGWVWGLRPDPRGRVLDISSFRIDNQWVYRINLMREPLDDPTVRTRTVLKAGGEYLERFGVKPGPYSRDAWERRTRYAYGAARPDLSDKSKAVQRLDRDRSMDEAIRKGALDMRVVDQGGKRHIWVR